MIIFKRLFSQPLEGEFTNSIIIYHRIPNIFYTPESDDEKRPVLIGSYRCGLRIDLWLAVLEFRWDTISKDYQAYLEQNAVSGEL